ELRADGADDWRLAGEPVAAGWAERFQGWAQRRLSAGLEPPDRSVQLIFAMVLGWKTALTDEVEEPFMRSGTMHLFAISGLHIALIAGIVAQALRLLLAPRPLVGVATIAVVWAYTAATGWQPSAVRATIMTTVVVGGWMLHRPVDLLNSLAAAALAILLWDARQLFAAGFQLSFAVVGALGLLLPRLEQFRDRVWAVDPFLPADALPRWQGWARPAWRLVTANLAVSLAAWLGSLPLTAHYFHLVSPVGLLANLLVVPLSSAVLVCALASLAFAWWPAVAELFNHSAWLWMTWADGLSRWFAERPGGVWHAATPPAAWTAAWFLALALAGLGRARWGKWRWGVALAAVVALTGFGAAQVRHEGSFTCLTVLPLRGGHAVFVEPARGGPRWLVDTGDEAATLAVTRPFLMARGVNRLPALALTHGDIRHVGGAPLIMDRFRPRGLLVPVPDFRSPAWDAALAAAISNVVPVRRVAAGDDAPPWRVRHPPAAARAARADDASLVLAGAVDGLRVALVADLSRAGQETWLNTGQPEPVDVLVTGLADQRPLSPAVFERLRPRLILVADAARPATARAPADARAAFHAAGVPVIFLGDTGSVRFRWRAGHVMVEDAAGRRVLEWNDGPSAGLLTQPDPSPRSTPVRPRP
ncbi:MAG: ComEC/Rec2 family competence protein, partial [Limisphaerales bacterium]